MIRLVCEEIIKKKENIKLSACKLQYEKDIDLGVKNPIGYFTHIKNNKTNENLIFFRSDSTKDYITFEKTHILKIKSYDNFIYDKNQKSKELYCASHNLTPFYDKNKNNMYFIGGKIFPFGNDQNYTKFFGQLVLNYLLDESNYFETNIPHIAFKKVLTHLKPSPIYGAGLYLFDDNFNVLNNKLPIMHCLHEGRSDPLFEYAYQYCTNVDPKNIKRGGLLEFDTIPSIFYIEKEKKYILYQRANVALKYRHIQYAKSEDLINWSEFNLVNFNRDTNDNICSDNYYHPNFFKLDNCPQYIGIIPYNLATPEKICAKGVFVLCLSNNAIDYNIYGKTYKCNYEPHLETEFICGTPYVQNNKFYFYAYDIHTRLISILYYEKYRMTCIENKEQEGDIIFNYINFDEFISLNFQVEKDGYLCAELLDENDNPIENFTFSDFKELKDINKFNFKLNWNGLYLPNCKYHLHLKFTKAKIYAFNNIIED